MNLHDTEKLKPLIDRCLRKENRAQHELFRLSYSYAMSICLRFASGQEEAQEVLNDGFLKVFNQLHQYDTSRSFAGWLRRVMINTAIDQYRRNNAKNKFTDISLAETVLCSSDILSDLQAEEVLAAVQNLSPAYRMVFLLHAVEGYTHEEIAQQLGINEGTSKSNLAKARLKLQTMLSAAHSAKNTVKS